MAYLLNCADLHQLEDEPMWMLSLFDGCAGAAVAWHKVGNLPCLKGYTAIEIDESARRCVQAYFEGRGELRLLDQHSDITNRKNNTFYASEEGVWCMLVWL